MIMLKNIVQELVSKADVIDATIPTTTGLINKSQYGTDNQNQ